MRPENPLLHLLVDTRSWWVGKSESNCFAFSHDDDDESNSPTNGGNSDRKTKQTLKKLVLRRLHLSENDRQSVVAFAKKLHLKDSCHMLADAWDSLTVTNLQNAWKKSWPVVEAGETSHSNRTDSDEEQILNEMTALFSTINEFEECNAEDAKERLNNDTNLTGCAILSDDDIVKSVNEVTMTPMKQTKMLMILDLLTLKPLQY
ncbi:hypothetical protein MML48_5g00002327 [Holotrichia oblita]|uniref:Uncharacterized protein n=1 Tax=Holotrichia oblita TaxID=644536 RepID=A0ACB9T241_HOLOL|nr:hypothetical protein MML48_5g00002327 [Holotrichia oblita]